MRKITQAELDNLLDNHEKWWHGNRTGERLLLADCELIDLDFGERDLSFASIVNCKICYINFDGIDFFGADLGGSRFVRCTFQGVRMCQTFCNSAIYRGCTFRETRITASCFYDAKFLKSLFDGSKITKCDFTSAWFGGAKFRRCVFSNNDLRGKFFAFGIVGLPIYQIVRGLGHDDTLTLCARGGRKSWTWNFRDNLGGEAELREKAAAWYRGTRLKTFLAAMDYLINLAEANKKNEKQITMNTKQKENNNE